MKKIITGSLVAAIVSSNTIGVEGIDDIIKTELVKKNQEIEVVEENKDKVSNDIDGVVDESAIEEDTKCQVSNEVEESAVKKEIEGDLTIEADQISDNKSNNDMKIQKKVVVKDYKTLKEEVKKENNVIELQGDIVVDSMLKEFAKGVCITGVNARLIASSLTTNVIEIKDASNVSINDITIEGYSDTAIACVRSKDVDLNNITLNGKEKSSKVGIESAYNSEITLNGIKTSNNTQAGIRLKSNSKVNLKGGNSHTNDTKQIVVVGNDCTLDNADSQYIKSGINGEYTYYTIQEVIDVNSEAAFENAVTKANAIINITDNFTITKEIVIKNTATNIKINGRKHVIDCNGNGKLTIKAAGTKIDSITFKNYLNTSLVVYNAKDVKLSNITLEGNSLELDNGELRPNSDRSKTGLDIYNSTVTLDGITSMNHLYKGIFVRTNSNITINSTPIHKNDTIHMQTVKATGENNIVINDKNKQYKPQKIYVDDKGKDTTDYFTEQEIQINSAKDLIDNAKNCGTILSLGKDITFDDSLLDRLNKLDPHPFPDRKDEEGFERDLGLNLYQNITLKGNGHTINLNEISGLVLKGNNTKIENVRIINSPSNGITVYNSDNTILREVIVENNKKSGIVANGSIVDVIDCNTINNGVSGIMSTRSRTLDKAGAPNTYRDSIVNIKGSLVQQESNKCMMIRNLEMIYSPDYVQNNQIIFENKDIEDKYNQIKKTEVKAQLSKLYKAIFENHFVQNNIDEDAKFGITEINFVKVLSRLDVTNQLECVENGLAIQLDPTGTTDNTEKLVKLLKYATLNGKELYFPQGTYKISGNIDLTQLGTWAFSNVKLTGEANGLSIIDASESNEMLLIENSNYHAQMSDVNINNLAFNNVGLSFNGVYKSNITINDNIFMNGKYSIANKKVTMTPYITANNSTYLIENNIFLRGKEYAGRGISTYSTKDTVIRNNFFGNIEGKEDAKTMLPSNVIDRLNLVNKTRNVSGEQGNFFTGINNERKDVNMTIEDNYFNMNESKEIEGVPEDLLISGIDVSKYGQRRDHIIYSKGYDGLNIVGNYFKGMANDASGGVKIRNGSGAYIGSNHFKDTPILAYIYGDLTKEECKLYDTTIYNNFFHETKNLGGEGTGILYYQSFKNGDKLNFSDGTYWDNAQGDVKNFVVYNNKFLSGNDTRITLSNRAEDVKDQFFANGNIYEENVNKVGYSEGNMFLEETAVDIINSKLNAGYAIHNKAVIPLYPAKVDNTQLVKEINDTKAYLENIKHQIGNKRGQYSPYIAKEIRALLDNANRLIQDPNATQWDINNIISEIKRLVDKLNRDVNVDDIVQEKPETPGTGPNDITEDNSSNGNMNNVNKPDTNDNTNVNNSGTQNENPKTGDKGISAMIGGVAVGLLGLVLENKKKKKN